MTQSLKYKKSFLLLGLMFIFSYISCKKQDLPVKPQSSPFAATMENNNVNFPAIGGSGNIVVKGGSNGWWVTLPATSWFQITKTYGSGDFKIPVTIRPNTTGVAREITVTINPTFDLPPVSIKLMQSN